MDFPRALRVAREQAGLTLRALAERAGTSHSTVAAYEAGRVTPRADTAERLLQACGKRMEVVSVREPVRDPRRGPADQEFAQVLTLVAAVGETPREDHRPWNAPIFRRLA